MTTEINDGYYFMFEIGWFIDLLIPTLIRVKEDVIFLVSSKPCDTKGIKPCCMPCGDDLEVKKLSMDDPVIKAFKSISSLIPIDDCNDLNCELEKNLSKKEIRDKYFNNTAKKSRETLIDRVQNDYNVLSGLT
jgi:hypothetical protein